MAAASIKSYADLLKSLLALGKNLPAAWAIVLVIFQKVQELLVLLKPDEATGGELQLVEVTSQEAELELQVAQAMVDEGSQALFDGSVLRQLWAFAKAHPDLVGWLLTLLKGG